MSRLSLASLGLGVCLAWGCATLDGDQELVERVRQELATDPMLNSSMVTVAERDGVIVLGGFVEKLEDMNAIRDIAIEVEGVTDVENNVVLRDDEEEILDVEGATGDEVGDG